MGRGDQESGEQQRIEWLFTRSACSEIDLEMAGSICALRRFFELSRGVA